MWEFFNGLDLFVMQIKDDFHHWLIWKISNVKWFLQRYTFLCIVLFIIIILLVLIYRALKINWYKIDKKIKEAEKKWEKEDDGQRK